MDAQELKESYLKALDLRLVVGEKWNALSVSWLNRWKQSVGLIDNPMSEENTEINVGKIDNSKLLRYDNELKKNLTQGEDFTLVHSSIYNSFKEQFGGGPDITREVTTRARGEKFIELFPLRCLIYTSLNETEIEPNPSRIYFSREKSISELFSSIKPKDRFGKTFYKIEELSIDTPFSEVEQNCEPDDRSKGPENDADDSKLEINENEANTKVIDDQKEDEKEEGEIAEITEHNVEVPLFPVTSWDSRWDEYDWKKYESDYNSSKLLSDVLDEIHTLLIVIDESSCFLKYLARWKKDLKVGEWINAQDKQSKWYEGRIEAIYPSYLRVHFMGWQQKFDEDLPLEGTKIQKLYTKTKNWRAALKTGSQVEVKASTMFKWETGVVVCVNEKKVDLKLPESPDLIRDVDIYGDEICEPGVHIRQNDYASSYQSSYNSNTNYSSSYYSNSSNYDRFIANGAVGLSNLGNTCFMNSMLQCLSNTQPLTEYFLKSSHELELNRDNPLGMRGALAETYGKLIKTMWQERISSTAPSDFKRMIGAYQPQFAGYQQQDSQELMGFLLDGLHEDLNRVRQKKYIEAVEWDGQADNEVAAESVKNFLSRNDSHIIDTFYGLLKSHVKCPKCHYESITFDPYCALSLPLPVDTDILFKFIFAPLPCGSPLVEKSIKCRKHASFKDFKVIFGPQNQIDPNRLHVVEYYSSSYLMNKKDDDQVRSNYGYSQSTSTVVVYEMEECLPYSQFSEPKTHEYIDFFTARVVRDYRSYEIIGTPHRFTFKIEATTNQTLYDKVTNFLQRRLSAETESTDLNELTIPDFNLIWKNRPNEIIPRNDTPITLNSSNQLLLVIEEKNDNVQDIVLFYKNLLSVKIQLNERGEKRETNDQNITLDQCFDKFIEEEQLLPTESWYCRKCKEHVEGFKKFDLWFTPDILIIHLKRFSYRTKYGIVREKLTELVKFPIEGLNLRNYIKGPIRDDSETIYDLFAVSEHSGGLNGGHYTATGMNFKNNEWYSFNDSHVSKSSPQQAVNPQAYVLFYKRRQGSLKLCDLLGLCSLPKPEDEAKATDENTNNEVSSNNANELPTDSIDNQENNLSNQNELVMTDSNGHELSPSICNETEAPTEEASQIQDVDNKEKIE